jgi:hypothetical protein
VCNAVYSHVERTRGSQDILPFWLEVARQRGSHLIMVKEGHTATLSVPNHKEVAKGTLRSLIRSAGLTASEFFKEAKNIKA